MNYILLEKITSGRRFLVVVAGLVLLGLSAAVGWRLAHVVKDPQMLAIYVALFGQIMTLIAMVYKDYFARDRANESKLDAPMYKPPETLNGPKI